MAEWLTIRTQVFKLIHMCTEKSVLSQGLSATLRFLFLIKLTKKKEDNLHLHPSWLC